MTKKPSLFAAKSTAAEAVIDAVEQPTKTSTTVRPPSRQGKRMLSIYLAPEAWKQLRMLSINVETPTQALGEEAINLLFEKHRLNRIA